MLHLFIRSLCIFSMLNTRPQSPGRQCSPLSRYCLSHNTLDLQLKYSCSCQIWCSYAAGVTEPPRLYSFCRGILRGLSDRRWTYLLCLLHGPTPNVQQNYGSRTVRLLINILTTACWLLSHFRAICRFRSLPPFVSESCLKARLLSFCQGMVWLRWRSSVLNTVEASICVWR